jgi:Tol biopolymer transport system component
MKLKNIVLFSLLLSLFGACGNEDEINIGTYFAQRTLWMSSNKTENYQIWYWRADTFVQVTNEANMNFWWPQLQPQGDRFICYRGPVLGDYIAAELWRFRQDGSEGEVILNPNDYGWRSAAHARYSPDGSMIIMSAEVLNPNNNTYQWQLFITDSLGMNPRRISTRQHMHHEPAFNPLNPLQIIYNAWPESEPNGFTFNPRWSLELHTARLDTPDFKLVEEKKLTNDNVWNASPALSWNGQRIAYAYVEDQLNPQVKSNPWTIWTNGSEIKQLRRDGTAFYFPCWTRDNAYIIFQRTQWGVTTLWMMNSSGENLTRIIPNDNFNCIHPFVAE